MQHSEAILSSCLTWMSDVRCDEKASKESGEPSCLPFIRDQNMLARAFLAHSYADRVNFGINEISNDKSLSYLTVYS